MNVMESTIADAIREKRLISFLYQGHMRIVEPHIFGTNSGAPQLLGYQIRGGSSSGELPSWRRFEIRLIVKIELLDETFQGRRHSPTGKHSEWDRVILMVN